MLKQTSQLSDSRPWRAEIRATLLLAYPLVLTTSPRP